MIVDAHVHIGKSMRLQINVDGETLVRIADQVGIDKICCTDLTALFYDAEEGNRLLYEEMKRFPDRIIGYATIPSTRFGKATLDELDRCYHDYGMRGLKLYSTPDFSIVEPATIPILEKCAELGMPILAHTTPWECEQLLPQVPECKFMIAHSGGQPWAKGDWGRTIMAAEQLPNLYLDLTSSTTDADFLEAAVARLGAQRIVFGTDTPLLDPYSQLAKVCDAPISKADRDLILGGNILRLMGLAK
jgi:uncharacterized protein